MERNKMSAIAMIAIIFGAAGLGAGAYSVFSVQTGAVKGDDGDDGDDGTIGQKGDDGQDAPGDIVVGILNPDEGETVSGNVTIRAIIAGSENYDLKVYINGSLNATYVPFEWNTTKLVDGWWNISVIATDVATNDVSQDEVIVYVLNTESSNPVVGILNPADGQTISGVVKIRALVYGTESYSISIRRNGTEIATALPYDWDTTLVSDNRYNITVIVTDVATNDASQDEVIVYILNTVDPTNIYYCSSQPEIEDALDIIGTEHGTLIITEDITLSSTINITGGGNYIFQGVGSITLDQNADDHAFNVSNAQSCTIKDLIINMSDIVSDPKSGIYIDERNDNPVHIENVQISGGNSRGIYINSENVWIENCIIKDLRVGIYLGSDSGYCHILDNSLININNFTGVCQGIRLYYSNFNTLTGNTIRNVQTDGDGYGISMAYSHYTTISGNTISNIYSNGDGNGISLYESNYNTLTGNLIKNLQPNGYGYGIYVFASDHNTFSDIMVADVEANSNSYGLYLELSQFNALSDSTIDSMTSGSVLAYGIYLLDSHNNTFTGNLISNLQPSGNGFGIYLENSNSNAFTGDVISEILPDGDGYGISLENSNSNVINSNTISIITINSGGVWAVGINLGQNSDVNIISSNTIRNIEVNSGSGNAIGIRGYGSDLNALSDNSIFPITSSIGNASGIRLYYSYSNTLTGNVIWYIESNTGNAVGIYLLTSNFNTIGSNTIYAIHVDSGTGWAVGIFLNQNSGSNTISGNTVDSIQTDGIGNAIGIWIYYSHSNALNGNSVNGIYASFGDASGILLTESDRNTLTGNVIFNINPAGLGFGIYLINSDYNTVVGNTTGLCKTDGVLVVGGTGNQVGYNVE